MYLPPLAESFLFAERNLFPENFAQVIHLHALIANSTTTTVRIFLRSFRFRTIPLVVGFLSDIVVFVWTKAFQEISEREQSSCLERVRTKVTSCTAIFNRFADSQVSLTLKLLKDLEEAMNCLTLIIFIVNKAAINQKL